MTKNPIISIFMPVYNGEKYIRKSIESVLNQTLSDLELVIVDDSSTDNSYKIIQEYAKIDERIVLLKKPNGGNVPKSWNFALPYLKGEFITYMSQDDWMSENNLELNYNRHLETGADIIVPDLIFYSEKGNKTLCGLNGNHEKVISGKEAFILSLFWEIHGFTLCKKEIMKSEPFDESSFNSDEYVTRKNFLLSDNVAFSEGVFFYFQDNKKSINNNFGFYTLTSLITEQKIINLMNENNIDHSIINRYLKHSFFHMSNLYSQWRYNKDKNLNSQANKLIKSHYLFLRERIFYKCLKIYERIFFALIMINYYLFVLFITFYFSKAIKR